MDLLIASNSVAESAADTVPSSGTPQYATDGNPVTGVSATTFPAYHYNMLMGELYNLVVAAGLTPSGSDWTQVQQAIKAISDKRYVQSPYSTSDTRYTHMGYSATLARPYARRSDGTTDQLALVGDLPFGANVHCQVFTVTIPSGSVTGYNSSGYTASIPTAFGNFMYAMGCDTGGGIYTVACKPSGSGSVKIYAQSPQNTAGNQTGGLALTIYAYGTY